MIHVSIYGKEGESTHKFYNKKAALRFMYAMRHKGYIIAGWSCDDYMDNEWLGRRFKL